MSASLVGSEMCIRDSVAAHAATGDAAPLLPEVVVGPADALRHVGSGVPVSYTHLTLPTICSV
eukprot:4351252-Alexandrium_andersonii.AAC.1